MIPQLDLVLSAEKTFGSNRADLLRFDKGEVSFLHVCALSEKQNCKINHRFQTVSEHSSIALQTNLIPIVGIYSTNCIVLIVPVFTLFGGINLKSDLTLSQHINLHGQNRQKKKTKKNFYVIS